MNIQRENGKIMKRQIRKYIFESNSSSVHTLVYSNDGRESSNFKLNKDGKIEVDFGEFGRDYCIYDSQYDKLSYLITCLYYLSGYEIDSIYDKWEFEKIEEAICSYTGATGIKILGQVEPYIDHQSVPDYDIEIINVFDEDAVINFVFNKNIALRTDSD
jgi:hypothetical protein